MDYNEEQEMERRRATDELLLQIQQGQAQLIEEISKPAPEPIGSLLLRYSAYIVPLIGGIFFLYSVITSSQYEIGHLSQQCKKTTATIEKLKEFDNSSNVHHSQFSMTINKNTDDIAALKEDLDKFKSKYEHETSWIHRKLNQYGE